MSQFRTGQLPDSFLSKISRDDRKPLGKAGQTFSEAEAKRLDRAEKELQNEIENYLRLKGIVANRSRMDKRKTDKTGWPDFTFAINGRASAVEVKRPGEKPTDKQIEVITQMIQNGWLVRVVFSLDEVRKMFEETR